MILFTKTKLKGAYLIDQEPIEDERGFFSRSFCRDTFNSHGLNFSVAQCNTSYCKVAGTLRGMHYQVQPHSEIKLVQCLHGVVYDVVIDLRPDSDTYLRWSGAVLTAKSHRMVYVPENFAHGYLSLTDNTIVYYLVSTPYHKESERTIRWNDPAIGIEWPSMNKYVISEKDRNVGNIQDS
jgi:dTDP-4-dehydrorhamnose 3,5-epimerase